jgi:acyl-CoA dehydrogenase
MNRTAGEGGKRELDRIMFPSHMDLPFFEERHRRLATELDDRAADMVAGLDHSGSELERARAIGRALGGAGWFRLLVADPEQAEGPPDVRSLCIARETLARHDGLADFVMALQGLGSAPILFSGSAAQRAAYMPRVITGEAVPAFALSEEEAGSDAAGIRTTAEKRGGGYILNGSKMWISNAGLADFYVVFARTGEAPGARGISAFIVDADTPGLRVSEQVEVMAPHVIAALRFEDCEVPANRLIGLPGEGFKIAMGVLDVYRSSVGAAALGFARRAFQEAIGHVRQRRLFGQMLSDFQATQMKLADMAADLEASAFFVYRAAWLKDTTGRRITYESSLAKMFSTEKAQAIIDSAVQLFGGAGLRKDSVLEKLYREIRPLRIYEGATEIQKLVIAGQLYRQWSDLEHLAEASLEPTGT